MRFRSLAVAWILAESGLLVASTAVAEPVPATLPVLFAAEREQLAARMEQCDRRRSAVQATMERLQADLRTMQEALAMPGMQYYVGPLLTERRRQLPDVATIRRDIHKVREESSQVYARYLDLEDELLNVKSGERATKDTPTGLQTLKDDYGAYWRGLAALGAQYEELFNATQSFARVIDEHSLWLPSAKPLYEIRFPRSLTSVPGTWEALGRALLADLHAHWGWYASFGVGLVLWAAGYRGALSRERQIRELVQHAHTDSFRLTTDALAIAVYRSAALPIVLWTAGLRLAACSPIANDYIYEFGLAVAFALQRTALFLFLASTLRQICRRDGVAQVHFKWGKALVQRLHNGLAWLIWIAVPAGIALNLADAHPDPLWRGSVGRLAGIVGMIAYAVFFDHLLRPRRQEGCSRSEPIPTGAKARYVAVMSVPVVLAVAGLTTYPHTVIELARPVFRTVFLVVGLVIARSLITRFVQVSRSTLAIEHAEHKRGDQASAETHAAGSEAGEMAGDVLPSQETITHRTTALLHWLGMFGLAIGLWLIWRDVFPALSLLGRVALWSYSADGGAPATIVRLTDLVVALLAGCMTVVLAKNGPGVLETAWLRRLPLDDAARFAVVTIMRYGVILVGMAVSLGSIGLGWSRIHWLAAGVTVGLGFGLQEIFANFISGLIILFERPVRIGDIVTVGGVDGKVTRIQIRATTVTDMHRRELIVPNKEFITGQIINWTLSDPVTRVDIPVGIAYGSNTRLARDLLVRLARECKHVLEDPAPMAMFKNFGDSTLDFELRVYIPDRDVWADVIHELHTRIDDEFRVAGIEIAFPQREIHIRSVPDDLRPAHTGKAGSSDMSPVSKSVRELQARGE